MYILIIGIFFFTLVLFKNPQSKDVQTTDVAGKLF